MKGKPERPVGACPRLSAGRSRDDRGEVPPGAPVLAPVRKEVRGIAVCAPTHIVDRVARDPSVSKLKSDQCREVAMRLFGIASDNRTTIGSTLHFASDFFADLERVDANVGTDRDHQIGRIVRQRLHGLRDDTGDGAAPPSMHGANVAARRVRDQDRHAISRARCNRKTFGARNECVALHVGNGFGDIARGDFAHLSPMHLPLLKEPIATEPEALGEARSIFENRFVVVAQVETEVEGVVRRRAHSARSRCKCVTKAMPIQKGGMESTHTVLSSMARLRGPPLHAKEAFPKPGQGVGCASISFRRVDRGVESRAHERPGVPRSGEGLDVRIGRHDRAIRPRKRHREGRWDDPRRSSGGVRRREIH